MVLQFDKRYSIGSIYVRYGEDVTASQESWQWLGQAIGPVEVPDGAKICLRFNLRAFPSWRQSEWTIPIDREPCIPIYPDVAYPESVQAALQTIDTRRIEYIDLRAVSWQSSAPLDLRCLARFEQLRSLELREPYTNASFLKSLPLLQSLDGISDTSIADDFSWIAKSTSLKRLRVFATTGMSNCTLMHLQENKSIDNLSVYVRGPILGGVTRLQSLPSLRQLSFVDFPLPVSEQRALGALYSLTSLELDAVQLSDAVVEHLCDHLPSLTSLSISDDSVSAAAFQKLAQLSRLEHLDIAGSRITDALIPYLSPLPKLRYLTLSAPDFTGASCNTSFWRHLPKLEHLDLTGSSVGPAVIEAVCEAVPKLCHLSWGTDVPSTTLSSISTLKYLTELSLCMAIDKESIAFLGRLSGLKCLRLSMPRRSLTGSQFRFLSELRQLHELEIINVLNGDSILKLLYPLMQLERIWLWKAGITDTGLQQMPRLPHLRSLDLLGNKITDDGLKYLEGLPELLGLSLTGNPISAQAQALEHYYVSHPSVSLRTD